MELKKSERERKIQRCSFWQVYNKADLGDKNKETAEIADTVSAISFTHCVEAVKEKQYRWHKDNKH